MTPPAPRPPRRTPRRPTTCRSGSTRPGGWWSPTSPTYSVSSTTCSPAGRPLRDRVGAPGAAGAGARPTAAPRRADPTASYAGARSPAPATARRRPSGCSGPRASTGPTSSAPTSALVVAAGEPPARPADDQSAPAARTSWSRPSRAATGSGPFVVPGTTACLRCVDAHLGRARPAPGAGGRAARRSSGGPGRPALEALAAALGGARRAALLARREPSTWSATVDIGAGPRPPATYVGAAPALRRARGARAGRGRGAHHHSLSSLPSIARRWVREHSSQ